jgi:hypothetical protein
MDIELRRPPLIWICAFALFGLSATALGFAAAAYGAATTAIAMSTSPPHPLPVCSEVYWMKNECDAGLTNGQLINFTTLRRLDNYGPGDCTYRVLRSDIETYLPLFFLRITFDLFPYSNCSHGFEEDSPCWPPRKDKYNFDWYVLPCVDGNQALFAAAITLPDM